MKKAIIILSACLVAALVYIAFSIGKPADIESIEKELKELKAERVAHYKSIDSIDRAFKATSGRLQEVEAQRLKDSLEWLKSNQTTQKKLKEYENIIYRRFANNQQRDSVWAALYPARP